MRLIFLLLFPIISYAQMVNFQSNTDIKASDINNNLSFLKTKIEEKNLSVNFTTFESGSIISTDELNLEINKINQLFGSNIQFEEVFIKSENFNNIFNQLLSEISNYNAPPIMTASLINTNINEAINSSFIAIDPENDTLYFSIVTPPSNGIVTISNNNFTYTPNLNYYGTDSFQIKANDGEKDSNTATFNITIKGQGIITVAGVKSYFDGSFANSCHEYLNNVNGDKFYWGSTGNGVYRTSASTTLTCDMTTPNGPYTARTTWNSSTYPNKMLAGEIFITNANSSSTLNPSVGAGVRLVGMFDSNSVSPWLNYMQNKSAYTRTASAAGGVPGRYNYFGPTASANSHLLWTNLGVSFSSNLIVLANGVVGKINTINNGCCGSGGESAYIYYYNASSGTIFWVKEN